MASKELIERYVELVERRQSSNIGNTFANLGSAKNRVLATEESLSLAKERVNELEKLLEQARQAACKSTDVNAILNLNAVEDLDIQGSNIVVRTKALEANGVIFGRYTITINLDLNGRTPIKVIADHPVPYKEFGNKAHHPFVYREEGRLCHGDTGLIQILESGDIPLLIGSIIDFLQTPQYVHGIHLNVFRMFKERQEEWQWC